MIWQEREKGHAKDYDFDGNPPDSRSFGHVARFESLKSSCHQPGRSVRLWLLTHS